VYEIRLDVTDEAGNSAFSTFDLTVRDTEAPVAALDPGNSLIVKGENAFWKADGSTDNVGIVKYIWTYEHDGETHTVEGISVAPVFDEAGEYEITLTVADAAGNTDSETFTLTVESHAWHWVASAAIIIGAGLATILIMRRLGYGKDAEEGGPEEDEGPDP
jgi:hypothetical protein